MQVHAFVVDDLIENPMNTVSATWGWKAARLPLVGRERKTEVFPQG